MRLQSLPLVILTLTVTACMCDVAVPVTNHWSGGFQGNACFDITKELHGWTVTLVFDQVISSLEVWVADVKQTVKGGMVFVLENKSWNREEHVGDELCIDFIGHGNGDVSPSITASMTGLEDGGSHNVITAPPTMTVAPPTGQGVASSLKVTQDWGARFEGQFEFPLTEDVVGWMVNVTFNKPVTKMDIFIGDAIFHSTDGYNWLIVNKQDRPIFQSGDTVQLKFFGDYLGGQPAPTGQAELVNLGVDDWTVEEKNNTDGSKYNYNDLLSKSILFYEAQRSGKLPSSNRIPYRGDSALGDKGDNGEDLTGGWYDAGDHIKFNLPMAYTTTALTWGLLQFPDAYQDAGQMDYMLDCIKWPLDYLLKCHTKPHELYAQVGDGGQDHSYWGPPEKMTMARPAFKITESQPGSDLAMETAAAFAAGYLAFKDINVTYARELLTHAEQLWEFGWNFRGKYSDSVQAAAGYYRSFNLTDELTWGSIWLYRATNDSKYLAAAEKTVDLEPEWGMSWDDKTIGNQVMLYNLTGKDKYKTAVEGSMTSWLPGGTINYTPKGLAWRSQWGSLRYSSSMAMGALMAAETGLNPDSYRHWAMCQIHYALGDTGFSYVVGFGDKFPRSPHHRSSSCPNLPAPCGPSIMSGKSPNVHILYGALVGGPDQSDGYKDDRSNYVNNEVADDYNAGFQSAVAGLKSIWLRGEHPEQKGTSTCPYV